MSSATEPPSLIVRAGERVAGRAELVDFAATLQRRLTGRRSFHCLLTNDAELRGLNRRFRGKNKATDVLSFPAEEPLPHGSAKESNFPPLAYARGSVRSLDSTAIKPSRDREGAVADFFTDSHGRDSVPIGDIAISLDRARVQARDFGHRIGDELRILMLHGVLHLLGMDHETDSGEMRRAELAWRKKLGLPPGLIERVRA